MDLHDLSTKISLVIDSGANDDFIKESIESWLEMKNLTSQSLFEQLSEVARENPEYAHILGFCYFWGIGTPENINEMMKWYKVSAELGYHYGQYNLGYFLHGGGANIILENKGETGYELLKRAMMNGSLQAAYRLGFCYEFGNGSGVVEDKRKAFICYQRAAPGQDFVYREAIAECYGTGEGTEQDLHKAIYWYRKAMWNGLRNRPLFHIMTNDY
ncbi:hypothetical protein G9A89_003487 [Geosiphon pyriformis]|nr:hypothetical protein G9A89_003487 [Geosiphon pyriformis]